jgi:hypothetical protein
MRITKEQVLSLKGLMELFMSEIFINIFIPEPSQYVRLLKIFLSKKGTLEDLESFLEDICVRYDTDKYGTTTWVNDQVIIHSGYFPQFTIPLSVSIKENRYGNTADQIACWEGFRKVCEMVQSREYL